MNTTPPGLPEYGQISDVLGDIVRRLEALERAARLTHSSIGSGGLRVHSGGKITVEDVSGDPQVVLDVNGLRVGDDVVVDASGLQVIGGYVTPMWPFANRVRTDNVSLTTSATDFLTVTINPPSWVQVLTVHAAARLQISNSSGGGQLLQCGLTTDDGGAFESRASGSAGTHSTNSPATNATTVVYGDTISLSPAGRSVNVVMDASVNTGTNNANFLSLSVLAFGTRT